MKNEIKLLRKAQKVLWENQYPGYPFQVSIIIDLEEKCGWFDYCGRKESLNSILSKLNNILIYQCLDARNTNKRTFIIDQHLEDYRKYLDYDYEDFSIDNLNAVKLYFALNSAIYNRKKKDKGFIFAVVDEDSEYVDVRVFNNEHDIQAYVDNYYGED